MFLCAESFKQAVGRCQPVSRG